MKFCIYDIEILKNLFTVCFLEYESGKRKEFVLYKDKEELRALIAFIHRLQKHNYFLVGFNSLNFDSQLIEFILGKAKHWFDWDSITIEEIITEIYEHAQFIINLPDEEKFKNLVPEWKLTIPQIDLFKQKHYDGKAKQGASLKWIQFTMRYHTVEEMPIDHTEAVSKEEIPVVLAYNWNDVESTYEFFKKIKFETDLRADLSKKYKLNLYNASEPRLAKMIFGKFLSEDMDIPMSELKAMKTFRKFVRLKDVIFPYIKFESEELNTVLKAVKEVTIDFHEKNTFKYTFKYGGIDTDIGLGGIHACCTPGVYSSNEHLVIEDIDVVSFYPNLAIVNDVKPHHLGASFSKIYNNIFKERQKIPKSDPTNYVYKIILNSTYGLSKEINSYLYDPFFTYSITINGQLSLLMLVEQMVKRVPGLKIYQENTDGITIGYSPEHKHIVREICEEWKALTKLELEHAFYEKMVIRDVNNYIGVKEGFDWNEYQKYVSEGKRKKYDKIKHKGEFEMELDFHKNPSFLIIPMSVEAYFLGNKDYRDYIRSHGNIYDFLGGVKKKRNFDLNLYTTVKGEVSKESQQKVTRFYVSTDGGTLVKDFKDDRKVKRTAVMKDWKVSILNKITNEDARTYDNINHIYYIKEAEKLISSIEQNSNQLTIF